MSMIACGRELGEMTVDHGARMDISREHAVPHLLEAYKRSKALTSTLLFVGGLSGLMAFYKTKDTYWLVGSGFLLGNFDKNRTFSESSQNLFLFDLFSWSSVFKIP